MWGMAFYHSLYRDRDKKYLEDCFNLPAEEEIIRKSGTEALNCIHPLAVEQYAYNCKWCGELNNFAGGECLECRKELYI